MRKKDIAIIGMACRFPDAENYEQFWQNLQTGVNSIREIPPERWDVSKYYSPDFNEPHKSISKWCGLVSAIDQFDHRFFHISPREAKNMDPQQRLLLEETWHCLEDSGVSLDKLRERITSVYVGFMAVDYYKEIWAPGVVTDSYAGLGNYSAILANRISYVFGFRGLSIALDTACASSLVALHHAKHSLIIGESDYAIAGGVSLNFHPWKYISFSKSRMLSPDGQCKTFDKDANGYVPGDGVGMLLLQRLENALNEGNHIYGIIKGSAVNHGGTTLSITAPRVEAQRDVILTAYRDAGFHPETVTYVEAHGTGTSLGDPIEIEALTRAFREYTPKRQFCKIGSVKTNIGHLEAAAGVAGVIKILLMMRYRQIPKSLNIHMLNPIINFKESPFEVAMGLSNWQSSEPEIPLRAGVSSFGFGGLNSHMLLEAFHQEESTSNSLENAEPESDYVFVLSAKTPKSLKNMQENWKAFVKSNISSTSHLKDICATLMTGRDMFPYRYGCHIKNKNALTTFLYQNSPSCSKSFPRSWCLRIGRRAGRSYAQVLPLIIENNLFRQNLNEVHKCFVNIMPSQKAKNRWGSKLFQSVDSFMVDYAYLCTLIDLGFTPNLVTYEHTGIWPALVISGMIQVEDALAVFTKQKALPQIKFARPRIPFYDPVTRQTFMRYNFDDNYVRLLVDELISQSTLPAKILFGDQQQPHQVHKRHENTRLGALLIRNGAITQERLHHALMKQEQTEHLLGAVLVEKNYCTPAQVDKALREQEILRTYVDELVFHHVDKARLLSTSQFTFKKYLEEWDRVLKRSGEDLEHLLHNNEVLFSDNETMGRKRLLLMVIIMASLHKLNRKWNLTEDRLLTDQRFYELLDLVIDGVMTEEMLVDLFIKDYPDYSEIARLLNTRQHAINPNNPYEYITTHSQDLWEIEDVPTWIEEAVSTKMIVPLADDMGCLEFGEFSERVPRKNSIHVAIIEDANATLKQSLLQLWLQGIDVHWEKLYPEGTFKKVALPVYAFDRKSFWISSSEIDEQRAGDDKDIRQKDFSARASLSPHEPILRDHVITGKPIIPGAYMIEFGLEAIQKTLNRPVKTLRNVIMRNPGIIETEVNVKVEIDPEEKKFVLKTDSQTLCEGEYETGE